MTPNYNKSMIKKMLTGHNRTPIPNPTNFASKSDALIATFLC